MALRPVGGGVIPATPSCISHPRFPVHTAHGAAVQRTQHTRGGCRRNGFTPLGGGVIPATPSCLFHPRFSIHTAHGGRRFSVHNIHGGGGGVGMALRPWAVKSFRHPPRVFPIRDSPYTLHTGGGGSAHTWLYAPDVEVIPTPPCVFTSAIMRTPYTRGGGPNGPVILCTHFGMAAAVLMAPSSSHLRFTIEHWGLVTVSNTCSMDYQRIVNGPPNGPARPAPRPGPQDRGGRGAQGATHN
jgi:hypothetical protein